MFRRTGALCAIALAVVGAGCVGRHRAPRSERVGLYRGTYAESDGRSRSFRVLLFASLPDRIRAEILGPVGRPRLILDGGGGKLAVTLPGEHAAWVGPAGEDELERILGFPVALGDLVTAVLRGEPWVGAVRMSRDPERSEGLPRSFSMELDGRSLRLDLQSTRKRRGGGALGTGAPPPGIEVQPMDELALEGGPPVLSEN